LLHIHFWSPFLCQLILIPYILQNPLNEDFLLNPFQKTMMEYLKPEAVEVVVAVAETAVG